MVAKLLRLLTLLTGLLFTLTGVQWWVMPDAVAPQFGLTLDTGLGLSSQIGDMSAFFLLLGFCAFMALVTRRGVWYTPAIVLLVLTAIGRIIAWVVHGAAFATDQIALELLVAVVYWLAARSLATNSALNE
ncbi:MAG: hypothetical protein EBY62_07725 [Cellvibrionales bacterium]|jgi:hypothetical protein|nr:hypothetical protein [Cellvibrionales bacterium]